MYVQRLLPHAMVVAVLGALLSLAGPTPGRSAEPAGTVLPPYSETGSLPTAYDLLGDTEAGYALALMTPLCSTLSLSFERDMALAAQTSNALEWWLFLRDCAIASVTRATDHVGVGGGSLTEVCLDSLDPMTRRIALRTSALFRPLDCKAEEEPSPRTWVLLEPLHPGRYVLAEYSHHYNVPPLETKLFTGGGRSGSASLGLPASAEFEVTAGRVTYVGSFVVTPTGEASHASERSDSAATQKTERPVAVEVVRDLPGALIALECAEPGLGVVVSDRIASHSGDPSSSFLRPLMRSYRLRFDLCRSALGGDAEAIARLIADGADVNTRGRGPSSSQGLTWPPEDIVEGLLNKPFHEIWNPPLTWPLEFIVEEPFRRECTPLGLAAAQGHTVAVELLLQHGAEVDAPQRWWGSQWTPLQLACASGHSTTAAALVAGGAQLGDDASDLVYGAAVAGHAALVETLLGCGVDIDGRSPDGRTPLDAAASAGNAAAVALLLSKGAKAMPRSVGATTPLHSAAWSGSVEVVSALLDHDADLGATDAQGDTPLHVAAGRGKAEVVRVLLDRGADLGATNAQGDTPLHVAAGHGQAEVVRVLLDRGADPRARNAASKTPLTLARKSRHQTVVRLLEKAR